MQKSTLGAFLLLFSCVSVFSQQPPRSADAPAATERTPPGDLRQIIPGHYVFSSTTYNSGIIVTNDGGRRARRLEFGGGRAGAARSNREYHPAAGPRSRFVDVPRQLFKGQYRLRGCAQDRTRRLSHRPSRVDATAESAGRGTNRPPAESDL